MAKVDWAAQHAQKDASLARKDVKKQTMKLFNIVWFANFLKWSKQENPIKKIPKYEME